MYGRYVCRAYLQQFHGFRYFTPLSTTITIAASGVRVSRTEKGDIPDWIAWDPVGAQHVLVEAKGRLSGKTLSYLRGIPSCVSDGLQQFSRVAVRDSRGRFLAHKDWLVASLWATDKRSQDPAILVWDPEAQGRRLRQGEIAHHELAMARQWVESLSIGFRRPEFVSRARGQQEVQLRNLIKIRANFSSRPEPPESVPVDVQTITRRDALEYDSGPHFGTYASVLVEPNTVTWLDGPNAIEEIERASERGRSSDSPVWLVGLSAAALNFEERVFPRPWIAEAGIALPNGLSMFDVSSEDVSAISLVDID